MRSTSSRRLIRLGWAACAWLLLAGLVTASAPGSKTLTFTDLMKFRAIQTPVLSEDGTLVAYALQPDRGDGEAVVHTLSSGKAIRVPRGGAPVISKNGRFVAMSMKVAFADSEKTGKARPKPGMALVDVQAGTVVNVENVDRFAFSDDSKYLACLLAPPDAKKTDKPSAPGEDAEEDQAGAGSSAAADKKPGGTLKLRNLESGEEQAIPLVAAFAFDPASKFLACTVADETGKGNGLLVRELAAPAQAVTIAQAENGRYEPLLWTKTGSALAYLSTADAPKGSTPAPATVWIWDGATKQARAAVKPEQAPAGWTLPFKNDLAWTKDGRRLFFGFKPADATPKEQDAARKPASDPYDFDQILSKIELDVWHWNDPKINSEQKKAWDREKDRTYRAVFHLDTNRVVPLADRALPTVDASEHARYALGTSDVPYAKETTWGEGARDVYLVDLLDGSRKPAISRLSERAVLSPDAKTIAFFHEGQWNLYDCVKGTTRNATSVLGVALHNEGHDTPDTPPAYGMAGWTDDGASLLVYDKFDIWQIPVAGGPAVNLTNKEGRARGVTFRVLATDPESRSFSTRDALLLTGYHEREKNWGFYGARFGKPGVDTRLDEKKLFKFLTKAKKADVVMFTRESYEEFPDVWVSDLAFKQPRKISDANPQIADFTWGSAELVEWRSADGRPLQGVLIKPANYQPGRRYPVITYFYERQSQRLYEFNEPVVNHRPSFAMYTGAGYAVFLPDVVFDIGHPGMSMVKCVVPGVQKLVDMGIADPNALGLHGHSWGGYGTAFVITQTSMFKAAVAGAAVSNMTSAYGGIRWESGVARLFQYEKTQSRIGGSLWEYPERFIENSALFYADRIKTPLLLEHGDDDGAVPWYQSIELYLAMRRLGKDCIFLQYRGEPHHLRKYPNKLDYAIKMRQYFDHYLKGEPAADWITKGVAYAGK
jgi:dipeptidyl aminopeptidase/acylaminoacyl peptidase